MYRAWQYIDQQYLYPLFGGRAPRGAGYRSPPPSPGKLVIHRVLGPGILKRLGPGQPRPLTMLGSEDGHCYSPVANQPGASSLQQPLMGRAGAAGADDAAAQPSAPAAPPKSGKRATFRSWPALSDAEHQPAAERGAAAAPLEAGAAVSQRALSQRSIGADTLETRPSSAVEGAPACCQSRRVAIAPPLLGDRMCLPTSHLTLHLLLLLLLLQSCSRRGPGGWTASAASNSTGKTGAPAEDPHLVGSAYVCMGTCYLSAMCLEMPG